MIRFVAGLVFLLAAFPAAAQRPELLPLEQIKPGMKGVAYTIFAGDTIEPVELEVIGIMPNLLGPRQSIILVQLKGAKVEFTGVVGGMSGSPVYFDGKLAGALSLRFGSFAKLPLAGVTPIENVLEVQVPETQQRADAAPWPAEPVSGATYPLPPELAERVGVAPGAFLTPIETPLILSGFRPDVLERFRPQLSALGVLAAHGGTTEPRPDDADIKPGDMVGMVMVRGDLNMESGCTVTAIVDGRVFVCGHPFLGYGPVDMPMTRGRVLTTLSSSLASVKMMNSGGVIGAFSQDRLTGLMGHLGRQARLIPVELNITTPTQKKQLRFEVMEHPKLTPLLVTISAFNGLVSNTAYSEGTTFRLTGSIELRGHPSVRLESMVAPNEQGLPDGFPVALTVQSVFTRIYNNPYEQARVEKVVLQVESLPEWRAAIIENAWSGKSEVVPGETLRIKVLMRPYRGAPFIQEVPITIPDQVSKGTLRILVSDADSLNRQGRLFLINPRNRLPGLDQLIALLNRERRNSHVYVTLLQPNPTLLLEDKEMPNAPLSQINVLDQRRTSSVLLRESVAGEWSVPMNQVVSGQQILTVTVR